MAGLAAAVDAQAKINLYLKVGARDASGYHPLETVFVRLDLADSIEIDADNEDRQLECAGADLGDPHSNLAWRAAEAFSSATKWDTGWKIRLVKKIPVGAGLGGGSADAAAVLHAMNLLAPEPLSQRKLEALALSLGADIPFLISNSTTALARGYGEVLTPIPALPPRFVALAIPGFGVATRDAYAWLDESNREPSINEEIQDFSWAALDQRVHNDFEPAVADHHAEIPVLRQAMLDAGASAAAMTGSGSVVFGLFDSEGAMNDISLPRGASLVHTRTAARVVQPIRIG